MQFRLYQRIPPRFVIGAWCALALTVCPAEAQKAGQITKSVGPSSVEQPPASSDLKPTQVDAAPGTVIHWHDILLTQEGARIRAQLNDGSILSLGQKTRLVVNKHDEKAQQSSLELQYGMVRASVVHLARPDSVFEVRTQNCVVSLTGTEILVDANSPNETVVWVKTGKTILDCSNPGREMRLEVPAGYYATSSGTLQPLTPEMLSRMNGDISFLDKLSDTTEVLQSEFQEVHMGANDQARHPLTKLVVPISRGRYVS
jgi:hypothetical protein